MTFSFRVTQKPITWHLFFYFYFTSQLNGLTKRINIGFKQVALRKKLFIIGGGVDSCEVYDSASKKFTLLNMRSPFMSEPAGAFAVGEEIFIVSGLKILIYDHVTLKWREKDFKAAGGAENYSCVKIPAIC